MDLTILHIKILEDLFFEFEGSKAIPDYKQKTSKRTVFFYWLTGIDVQFLLDKLYQFLLYITSFLYMPVEDIWEDGSLAGVLIQRLLIPGY